MKFTKKTAYLLNFISLAVVSFLLFHFLGQAVVPVSYADYYKHDLSQMKKKGQTYDLIFVGASRTFRSFDPKVFARETDYKNVLNAGSVAQTIEGSYYLTRELIKKQHPKRLVVGLSYNELFYQQEDKSPRGNMVLYDRLEDPLVKAEFVSKVLKGNDLLYLSNLYRYGSSISPSYLASTWQERKKLAESDFAPVEKKKEYYDGNGFVYSKRTVKKGATPMRSEGTFSEKKVDPDKLALLGKIIDLCKEKGIKVSLVTGPTSLMTMYNITNYQGATDFYTEYAKEKGISYYNLNMLKGRLDLFPDDAMLDYNHVNGEGARRASEKYAKVLKLEDQGKSAGSMFYKDLDQVKKQVDRVVACKATRKFTMPKGTDRKYMNVNSLPAGAQVEYKISYKKPGAKKYRLFAVYSNMTIYDVTGIAKPGTKILIYARIKGHDVPREVYQRYTVSNDGKKLTKKHLRLNDK